MPENQVWGGFPQQLLTVGHRVFLMTPGRWQASGVTPCCWYHSQSLIASRHIGDNSVRPYLLIQYIANMLSIRICTEFCRTGRNAIQANLMTLSSRELKVSLQVIRNHESCIWRWLKWAPQHVPDASVISVIADKGMRTLLSSHLGDLATKWVFVGLKSELWLICSYGA